MENLGLSPLTQSSDIQLESEEPDFEFHSNSQGCVQDHCCTLTLLQVALGDHKADAASVHLLSLVFFSQNQFF